MSNFFADIDYGLDDLFTEDMHYELDRIEKENDAKRHIPAPVIGELLNGYLMTATQYL